MDPRLLRFELEIPPPPPDPAKSKNALRDPRRGKATKVAKPKLVKCELPEGIRPSKVDKRLLIELHPDEYVVEMFDPRLYCLPTAGKSPLDFEVKVTPRLGWPVKTKPVWRKGKREEEVLPQVAPFVATPASEGGRTCPLPQRPSRRPPRRARRWRPQRRKMPA